MYQKVGEVKDFVFDFPEPYWNPPGWGSCKVDMEKLRGHWPTIRLAMITGMKPGSYFPFHKDNPAAENGLDGHTLTRYHIVLTTNPQCWVFHDGTWSQLEQNGIYLMDPSKEHASINLGETNRYHLVVDIE